MKDLLKRFLGCLLVLATCIGTQAVCPMMLFAQPSQSCARHHSASGASEANQNPVHDCCPRKRPVAANTPCASPEITGTSVMSCCSVPAQPANATQSTTSNIDMVVVGQAATVLPALAVSHSFEVVDCGPPLRGVLNLKEDLRI